MTFSKRSALSRLHSAGPDNFALQSKILSRSMPEKGVRTSGLCCTTRAWMGFRLRFYPTACRRGCTALPAKRLNSPVREAGARFACSRIAGLQVAKKIQPLKAMGPEWPQSSEIRQRSISREFSCTGAESASAASATPRRHRRSIKGPCSVDTAAMFKTKI